MKTPSDQPGEPEKARNNRLQIDFQNPYGYEEIPAIQLIRQWVVLAYQGALSDAKPLALSIRLVDESEGETLNADYRNKDYATNVLSFPFEAPDIPMDEQYLGDLVLCEPVIHREASEQKKSLFNHWAHLVIHGVLHLQGYDHIDDHEAEIMEQLEISLLKQLDIPNPYQQE